MMIFVRLDVSLLCTGLWIERIICTRINERSLDEVEELITNQRGSADYKPVLVLLFLCSKSMNASTFELVMYPSVICSSS